jgi:hypothetical protein
VEKMKSRLFICLGTALLMALIAGCSSLSITIDDANPPRFSFSAGQFAECCDHLAFLTVYEVPSDDSDATSGKIIWEIWPVSGTDNSAKALPKITYGQVPSGFVQKVPESGPAPKLGEGKIYEASGPRMEVPEAHVRFRIQNGKAVQIVSR